MATERTITDQDRLAAANLKRIWGRKKKELNLTQEKAADAFGIKTQSAISQWLNGKVPLGPVAVLRFARLLEVDPTDIRPDFEFRLLSDDIPPDVIEMVTKIASLPEGIRQDIKRSIDHIADSKYSELLDRIEAFSATNHTKKEHS